MEELAEKVEQVLSAVAEQASQSRTHFVRRGKKYFQAKLRDGSTTQIELTPDMCLGIGDDDKDKLAEQLRSQGVDVESLEIPRSSWAHALQSWSETLSQAFTKAWAQRVDLVEFCEIACKCGEGLLALKQYNMAYRDVYFRYSDRLMMLSNEVIKQELGDPKARKVAACSRFYLGSCTALYQDTIHRDEAARRSDTIDILRDVLKDILTSVKLVCRMEGAVREELYWCIYNASLLAMRVTRWLRIHGFGGLCVQPLWLLAESMNTCLPLMAVHMLPFRSRFLQELAYCAESAAKLGEAGRVCTVATQQLATALKLETMLPPVPEETTKAFEVMMMRFKLLSVKFDFWSGKVADASQLSARAKELSPDPIILMSCLLETLQFQHRRMQHFGAEDAKASLVDLTAAEDGKDSADGLDVTKFNREQLQAKQADLLGAMLDLITPLAEKAENASEVLEEFTVRRLKWDTEEERRARSDTPREGAESGSAPQPPRPDAEKLQELGFRKGSPTHTLEEVLPLGAHAMLVEQCLKFEGRGGTVARLKGSFELLERSLALRLRYRHFLRPPLVDIDVLAVAEAVPEKVQLPAKYELLTGDLNVFSHRNRPAPGEAGLSGTHVYIIGRRFDPWDSWTSEYPVPVRRLCNLRVAFLPVSQPPVEAHGPPPDAVGLHEPRPIQVGTEVTKPWASAYRSAGAGDSSGFEILDEAEEIREALVKQLVKSGHLTHRALRIPVDAHPGADEVSAKGELLPYLYFCVYDEKNIWVRDEKTEKVDPKKALSLDDQTLLPSDAAAATPKKKVDSETLLPPWSPLMDSVAMATDVVSDFSAFVTKHSHASAMHSRFNALLRADLRQTPGELQGKPFQSYVLMCAAVDAPSVPLVAHRLRILRALHSLRQAKAAGGEDFFQVEEAAAEGAAAEDPTSPKGRWKRPLVMDRLLELADCMTRATSGTSGQLFLFDAADLFEEVCSYVFLNFAWPKLCFMQDLLQQHELGERLMSAKERSDLSEWSQVLRRVLPILLRTLEQVQTVDGLTLGSASYALAQLFLQENDSKTARKELGLAIARLEKELADAAMNGPQARLDAPPGAAVSFDPPSVRSPSFALFQDVKQAPGSAGATVALEDKKVEAPASPKTPRGPDSPPASPRSPSLKKAESEKEEAVMLLRRLPRSQQDRVCLLARLYDRWIDCSLIVHLKNTTAAIKRKLRPNEAVDLEEEIQVAGEGASTRLALSNQEAAVLARLGENPYLRCLFFVSVAQRRPEVAPAALGKANMEVETAATQERNLWQFSEKEILRQQSILRTEGVFGQEFKRAARMQRKPRATPAVVCGRAPGVIRLRAPPLLQSPLPPLLPCSAELKPPAQEYIVKQHGKTLGLRTPLQTPMTCVAFVKTSGVGTTVSDIHKDLPGTGIRHAGLDVIEITGLKPNTNYCFATMLFEGFEAKGQATSSVSETSPPVGNYFPLPVALLRVKICKAALRAGEFGDVAMKRAWVPLFESFCERCTPAEEFDSSGLRTYKLRLDVADRLPPAVAGAFVELLLLRHSPTLAASLAAKNGNSHKGQPFPCTRPLQRAVLQAVNECIIAVDCARRAGNGMLTRQAVSLTLRLLCRLLQYRTKPHALFAPLAKCTACLEAFPLPDRQLPWHSQARSMAMYLLHQVTVMSVQLRQVSFMTQQLQADLPARYDANPLAEAEQSAKVRSLCLNQALELALLGSESWPFAEKKARLALKDAADIDELVRLLKELSERNYAAVARDSAALVLREEPERPPFALSLLRAAATRAQGELADTVTDVLSKHMCSKALDGRVIDSQQKFVSFGFMLRALPPSRLSFEEAPSPLEDGDEATMRPADGAAAAAEAAEEEAPPQLQLEDQPDSVVLAQLELMNVGPKLQELSSLRRLRHDISRFCFLDLQQVAVPLLSPDGATLGVFKQHKDCDDAGFDATQVSGAPAEETDEGEAEPATWEAAETADRQTAAKSAQLLQELLRTLARAAGYAASQKADQLLQAALAAALNALLVVGPSPADCVPKGPKSNPKDIDPDKFVGAEDDAAAEAPEGGKEDAEKDENDVWLSLAVIAELAVGALQRLKQKFAKVEKPRATGSKALEDSKGRKTAAATVSKAQAEELAVVSLADEASKELQAADEELHDVWFEKMPELDVNSVAKLVAFSVLCLYHMRRWSNIIVLCRGFNDATCSVFATTFLPLMIGAQKEVCNLSSRGVANTQRYLAEAKTTFDTEQKKLPRKLLRQLALQGELSEPEKLFKKRSSYYEDVVKRQQRVHGAWMTLLESLDASHSLVVRAVPAAMEQLRKSRLLLAEFLHDRNMFSLAVQRDQIKGFEKTGKERALRLASTALVSSYRKAVELLRKRQMSDQVVQGLHELGNLLWLEGDPAGARSSWSDAVDTAYQYVYAIKNWQKCAETAVTPPQDAKRAEIMLLTVAILAKHARLTTPKDTNGHLNAALFASEILEAVLTSALPHPSRRELFAPDKYRLREIFFGLRETRMILPPNSVYGGVDGMNFLGAMSFFHSTLMALDYQPARCLPICAVYNYVATDVCRNLALATKGRLMMAKALIKCRSLTEAWLALYALSKGHDKPRPLTVGEYLDTSILDAKEMSAAMPFRCHEEPTSEANVKAINELMEFTLTPSVAGCGVGEDAVTTFGPGAFNLWVFSCLKAEFLLCVASYGRVFVKTEGDEPVKAAAKGAPAAPSEERIAWLDKADAYFMEIWKLMTGNEDDREAWSTASRAAAEKGGEAPDLKAPLRPLTEEEGELCSELRLSRAKVAELRGDLGKGIQEVLYGMNFLTLLASPEKGIKSGLDCNVGGAGGASQLRAHPGSKSWMRLRRFIVHLLVSQGRLEAASAHIEQALAETKSTRDDVARVELLSAKMRVETLSGRLLELRGDRHLGAVPAAEVCLATAARNLPIPTPSAVYARMCLCTLLEQNPALLELRRLNASAEELEKTGGAEEEELDPNDLLLLEAQGKIVISPIAKDLQAAAKNEEKGANGAASSLKSSAEKYRERQTILADMVAECVSDLDRLLDVQGFQLRPGNLNNFLRFADLKSETEDMQQTPEAPLLPSLKPSLRKLVQSDSREPPNCYLELMPLRLHCELQLATLRLALGDMDEAGRLLMEAEARIARCVYLLPWLYVKFCTLKLQFRRLTYRLDLAKTSAPPSAPNDVLYRDPKTFASAICPATDSPLYRTFLQRTRTTPFSNDAEWVPPAPQVREFAQGLKQYLQELLATMKLALREGGHDCKQLLALLREALEEVLRVEALKPNFERIHALFQCFTAVAGCRKALLFNVPKGPTGPPPADSEKLPLRVSLDLQRHLQRQATEGGLAYSPAALQAAQKTLLFRSVLRHALALRRECDLFDGLFHSDRLLCDQLHVALANTSEAYAKGRIVEEAMLLRAIDAPGEAPCEGQVLVLWTEPDLAAAAAAASSGAPPSECRELLAFVCASVKGEEGESSERQPLVARSSRVQRLRLTRLADRLSSDLEHCRPAAAVAAEHVERRLREVTSTLRGSVAESLELGEDSRLDEALEKVLGSLAGEEDGPRLLNSKLAQEMLRALVKLLDPNLGSAQASHPDLGRFLRSVLGPLSLFPR